MNNRLAFAVLAFWGLLAAPSAAVLAAEPALTVAVELKIAVLDTQRALISTEEAQEFLTAAQSELQQQEAELTALGEAIQGLQKQLETDGAVMGASAQRDITKQIEDKQIEYQYMGNRLQKQSNDARQELLQIMAPKLNAVLQDLIALEGYDLIMERANLRYVNPKHDITRKVTEKLNDKREKTQQAETPENPENPDS